jgi:hypothetical protein
MVTTGNPAPSKRPLRSMNLVVGLDLTALIDTSEVAE